MVLDIKVQHSQNPFLNYFCFCAGAAAAHHVVRVQKLSLLSLSILRQIVLDSSASRHSPKTVGPLPLMSTLPGEHIFCILFFVYITIGSVSYTHLLDITLDTVVKELN